MLVRNKDDVITAECGTKCAEQCGHMSTGPLSTLMIRNRIFLQIYTVILKNSICSRAEIFKGHMIPMGAWVPYAINSKKST